MERLCRKCVVYQTCLLPLVYGQSTDRRARTGIAAGIFDLALKHLSQTRLDERPRTHVLRLFLTPNEARRFSESFGDSSQLRFCQRVQLLDPDQRSVGDAVGV